jgi:putative exporter of polyketide antibiotics
MNWWLGLAISIVLLILMVVALLIRSGRRSCGSGTAASRPGRQSNA